MTASFSPVASMLAFRRALYGLVSVNGSGSVDIRSLSYSVHVAVEQHAQALGGADPEVMRALRADVEVGREILVVDRPARSPGHLTHETFGHAARLLLGRRGDRLRGLLEPGHQLSAYSVSAAV